MPDSPLPQDPIAAAPAGLFPATAWTLVQDAVGGEEAAHQRALNELLERYWKPIYIYLRRSGRNEAEAEDLTQGFFLHLLEKDLLERVRIRQVRFRAYLRGVLEHYLANEARLARAKKRKGALSLDIAAAESWLAGSPADSPESAFDGVWAVESLNRAVARLRQELEHAGRSWVADGLLSRFGLSDRPGGQSVQELSKQHGVSENQMSVALHRARHRLRELILEEIRDSVSSAEEAHDELQALFASLQKRRS